jgi:parallel beta-helix repeat protein
LRVEPLEERTLLSASYYVNDATLTYDNWCTAIGNDANDGLSPSTPKATVRNVLDEYNLEPGDRVRIDTGTYTIDWPSYISMSSSDEGAYGSPVVFEASPYGVTLDGGLLTGEGAVWSLLRTNHVTITTAESAKYPGVSQRWMRMSGAFGAVRIWDCRGFSLSRTEIVGSAYWGVDIYAGYRANLSNNLIHGCERGGIVVGNSSFVTIDNNTITENPKFGVKLAWGTVSPTLQNNIITADGTGNVALTLDESANPLICDYNNYYLTNGATWATWGTGGVTLDQWRALTGSDMNSLRQDPLFVDPANGDYHLASTVGSYHDGTWTADGAHSPCVDAGTPTSSVANEPLPNGRLVNLGAYGNTEQASISTSLYVVTTEAANVINVRLGLAGVSRHRIDINGMVTTYDPAIAQIHIDGLGGNDQITILGTDQDENVTLVPGAVDMEGDTYQIHATSVEGITVNAGTGTDQVTMTGSADSNRLYSYTDYSRLTDSPRTLSYRVEGFETLIVDAPGSGRDYAYLYDSPDNDVLSATPDQLVFTRGDGTPEKTVTTVNGFQRAYVYATQGGTDTASLTGAVDAANRFYGYADYAILTDSRREFYFYARGFDEVTGESLGSASSYAYLYDSPGTDSLSASPLSATMNRAAPWSSTTATGFARIYAYSTLGGNDTATLNGSSAGGNQYRGYPTYSTLTDTARSFYHYTRGFRTVTAVGSQSDPSGDRAYLYDSPGDDTFDEAFMEGGKYQGTSLTDGSTYENLVKYFDLVYARSSDSGSDDTMAVDDEELLAYRLIRFGTW